MQTLEVYFYGEEVQGIVWTNMAYISKKSIAKMPYECEKEIFRINTVEKMLFIINNMMRTSLK